MIPTTASMQDTMTTLRTQWESDLVEALLRSLQLAKEELRIFIGLGNARKILEIDPSSVVMCILPVSADKKDILSHVQLKLIEAFCNEHEIRMTKVICAENLQTLLGGKCPYEKIQLYDVDEEESEENDDFEDGLIVIQESSMNNIEDQELRKFYDVAAMHSHARPIVRLRS